MFGDQAMDNREKNCLIGSILLFYFFCKSLLILSADRITPGQSISGKQTIISQGGSFELGFFSPGNSQNHYIGIWYKNISKRTIVWVANRETPLPNTSSELRISDDGNLVLLNTSKISIWSTNSTSTLSKSAIAVLLDDGNLVLRDGLNSSTVIWQSFDHPTDTWLLGAKLGFNKITGEVWRLTSWRSSEDPSPGPFSLELDTNGTAQFLLKWNGSQPYWSSGAWNGKFFSFVPEMELSNRRANRYGFMYVTNDNESYFTYVMKEQHFLARFVLDVSGKYEALNWVEPLNDWNLYWTKPTDQCQIYSLCGAFGICNAKSMPFCTCLKGFEPRSLEDWNLNDKTGGCVRKIPFKCVNNSYVNGEKDSFLMIPNMELPIKPLSLTAPSAEKCQLACLNNCSCTAYAFANKCSIWMGELLNFQQMPDNGGRGRDIYIRVADSEKQSSSSSRTMIIGASVGSLIGIASVFGTIFMLYKRCKMRAMNELTGVHGYLVPFTFSELKAATANFSEKLGAGGFGSVFKGKLPDSTLIAVKKLEGLRQGEKQFRMEVCTLGMIQHVNLVPLRGFCSRGSEKLLVYDFMPNGSLDSHLFGKHSELLDWKTRYQIALGIAKALHYLHEQCRECIIHCDIKPANILLDAEFCPKIADFGMAKLLGHDFGKVLTTMRGTVGYLAPEWISGEPITVKVDVYSYGMMLLEIISGNRNTDKYVDGDGSFDYFPIWASNKLIEGDLLSILDTRLRGKADMDEIDRACKVACWCIQDNDTSRPSMGQVVQHLEGVLSVNIPSIPRYLQLLTNQGTQEFHSEVTDNQMISDGD